MMHLIIREVLGCLLLKRVIVELFVMNFLSNSLSKQIHCAERPF